MKCPVDPEVELVRISIEGLNVDYCGKCRGHWLDQGEISKLAVRDAKTESVVSNIQSSSRGCPKDGTRLTEVDFPQHSGLRVDICPTCKGIWLDAHELSQALTLLGRPADGQTQPSRSVFTLVARLTGRHRGT